MFHVKHLDNSTNISTTKKSQKRIYSFSTRTKVKYKRQVRHSFF